MLAGAAVQQQAQSKALKQQKELAVQAQQRQLNSQNQATDAAMKRVQEFDPNTRQQNQQQIQQDLTGTLDQQVNQPQITAQGVQVGSTIPDAAGSTDYMAAKARETAKTTASLRGLAALMGRIGSAGELRRGEAVGIGDTAGAIGRIQNGAENMFGADQAGINSVQPSPGMMLAGAALSAAGKYGVAKSATTPKSSGWAGDSSAWGYGQV